MVSAWATQNRLVLGQLKVEKKSNEITAGSRADKAPGVVWLYSND